MNKNNTIEAFFRSLAPKVINLVTNHDGEASVTSYKVGSHDFATAVDIAVEKLIVKEIENTFPVDNILAEEEHNSTSFRDGRVWIIDPICGTNNLGRGIKNFCTNIALAEDGKVIASCVIDHSQSLYYWSAGDGQIYQGDHIYAPQQKDVGTAIDIDLGALPKVGKTEKERHAGVIRRLLTETDYILLSLNTSLGFAYIALGKIDGAINLANFPWDICAASFLIQTSGGIITDLEGQPWDIGKRSFIAAKNKDIHQKLLEIYHQ